MFKEKESVSHVGGADVKVSELNYKSKPARKREKNKAKQKIKNTHIDS